MNYSVVAVLLVLVGAFFGCESSGTDEHAAASLMDADTSVTNDAVILEALLNKSISVDTMQVDQRDPFLYFKSGYFLDEHKKYALAVICPADSMYDVCVYTIGPDGWQLIDGVHGLDAFPVEFDVMFKDYNFDGQNDVFIQVTVSNGWAMSRGHLLIVDPKTKELQLHPEAKELANLRPDTDSNVVFTEEWDGYDSVNGEQHLVMLTHRWINNALTLTGKRKVTVSLR
ncbi:MAG: hypothetical protein H6585_04805 [Flavobacteriales bacterium]|nr:hypothetical protein [Flavobacteriales bacterium]MCB9447648.1 hypothetical protein [Flavobacteriales bacterium]